MKVGHSGTLDPIASGLLLLLLGRATKNQAELMGRDKIYRARMRLGLQTDTADITGRVVAELPIPTIDSVALQDIFQSFIGPQNQIPPMYSALKQGGQPLYRLARQGKTVDRAPRPIIIHALDILESKGSDIEFRVNCSTGTYVRTLIEDIGNRLGTAATMVALVRESIGEFSLDRALPAEKLADISEEELLRSLLPLREGTV